ncbi:hypothetical protein QL919_04640 [Psychrobacter sp. APC 3426]|uniref:hypothetical protein n=1 Tax=Psychrobacter sp. APC 3426 TaxID=3035177 RepID=UPI0025B56E88|nr:hypothetical protein [Psychrobacter sp. APC 3426]MDN3398010.1 hypothetical protein [Psychrobacter sp. APC 3426]
MSIIDQLEQTVTPAVLGDLANEANNGNVAYVSLLEQFYAILAARLALPEVYSQLLRTDQVAAAEVMVERPLFEQLWQDYAMQQVIIQELSATHHIDEVTTAQLVNNAAPLAYRELKTLANGQFLPAFLQGVQPTLRQYLPTWSAPVIQATATGSPSVNGAEGLYATTANNSMSMNNHPSDSLHNANIATSTVAATSASLENTDILSNADTDVSTNNLGTDTDVGADAIHANPAAHHLAENNSLKQAKVRTRNQRNDLLVRVFLLLAVLAGLGLAAWALFIKPNINVPVEPVATTPVAVIADPEPPLQTMTPVELIVGVDNSGSLYTCSATVGDEALQSVLQQSLNSSFGEQASICQLTIQSGVANNIANLPVEVLPNVLTMLRSTPFARLQLQNDRITLEAPDAMMLQRLLNDIRNLAPAMVIDTTAPMPLPNNGNDTNDMSAMNGSANQFEGDGTAANNQYGSDYNNGAAGEYQPSDDDTGDSVVPTPNNNDSTNRFNNNATNIPSNSLSNNSQPNNRQSAPPGPISLSEVDDMASSVIVAEPAQVRQ